MSDKERPLRSILHIARMPDVEMESIEPVKTFEESLTLGALEFYSM